jgi:tRNA threonylcarbamoyladenosine biosynthesis protein TsaE
VIRARTTSVEATRSIGEAVAGLARPGDILVLAGDLGAGKTAFAQGVGRGLGVAQAITSPTFTIASTYQGRMRLHHLDVYRMESLREVEDIGIAELVDDGAVTLVEWGDVVSPLLPSDYLEVHLTFGEGDDERDLALRPVGPSWGRRVEPLRQAVAAWPAEVGGC